MAIDYSKYLPNGKKKSGIDYSKYLPSPNVGLNASEEDFRAWKGDMPVVEQPTIEQIPIEKPTADAYRALKGDITQTDALRMLKGDVQPPPQTSALERANRALDEYLQSSTLGRVLSRLSEQGGAALTGGASMIGRQPTETGNETLNTILDVLGTVGGIAANPAAGLEKFGAAGAARGLGNIAPTIAEKGIGRAMQSAAGQASVGTGLGLQQALGNAAANQDYTLGQGLRDVGESAALFGALGGLGQLTGQHIRNAAATALESRLGGSALGRLGTNIGSRVAGGLGTGAAFGAGTYGIESAFGNEKAGKDALEQALFGAIFDTVFGGKGVSRKAKTTELPKQQLALPPSSREGQLMLPLQRQIAGLLPPGRQPDFVAGYGERVTPRRFTPEDPTARLNRVMEEIKPDVLKMTQEAKIPPLESKKAMIDYISEAFPNVSRNEIRKLSLQEMQDLSTQVAREKHAPLVIDAARQAAANRGYNLDQLFEQATNRTPFIERARPIAERSRLAQAAGVTERPSIGRGPTEKVPFVEPKQALQTKSAVSQPVAQSTKEQVQKVVETLQKYEQPVTKVGPVQETVQPLPEQPKKTTQQAPKQEANQLGQKERGFIETLKESPKTQQGLKEKLKGMYKPITNKEMVEKANLRISEDIEKAVSYVTNARVMTAEHVTTGDRLIQEFQKQGNFERAVDIAEKLAEAGTKAGQSIQAYSIYNRLTPEGILVHANRIANRINEKGTILTPEVKITEDMAAKLTDLASTVQTMTGTKEVANDVISIAEKAKSGKKLTDEEAQTLQKFVQDASQFIGDIAPRKTKPREPKPIPDKRVRDNVIDFFDAQEKAAKERLRAKGYRVMSGIPVDDFYDWSIVGASKLAKGTVKFADWSEMMVKEIGEQIKPYLQQVYDKAVEVFNSSSNKISRTKLSEVEKITNRAIKDKAISPDEAATIKKMAEKVATLSGDAKIEASQDLQGVLQALERPSIGQKISTLQTMAQLLNPKTWIRNLVGNELFYRMERLNKWAATPIDWARVKLFGGERSVTFSTGLGWEGFFNPAKIYAKGLKIGVKAGLKGVSPEGLTTQYDLGPTAFSSKWNPATYLEKILGASMRGFDYAAYLRAKNQTILELANLRAINEGLKGAAKKEAIKRYAREADERILNLADEYGKYVTFQDNNALSVGLQNMKRGINRFLPLAPDRKFGAGDLVLKYPRTPGALLMRALEYSPAGLLRSAYILAGPIWKRDPNTREVMMSLTRAITGTTGFTMMGYILADAGILTGSSDKDKDIRELQRMAGQGQFRVNFSALKRFVLSGFDKNAAKPKEGDRLITYDWMQPLALSLAIGANTSQSSKEEKKGLAKILGEGYSIVDGALSTITELSVLRGLMDAVEGYPGESVTDKLLQVVTTLPTSFTPTLGNQIRQYQDNTSRLTYDPDKLQELINKVKNKIPGLAGTLPPEYGTLGKQKEIFQGQGNTFFNVFLNPAFTSEYKLTPEAKTVVDLIERTGEKKVAPRAPSKYITIKGNRYDLTPQEYSQLQRRVGEETAKRLQKINPNAKDESQIKRIVDILNEAGKIARREIEKKHPEIQRK